VLTPSVGGAVVSHAGSGVNLTVLLDPGESLDGGDFRFA
jgi:hypothetical protein